MAPESRQTDPSTAMLEVYLNDHLAGATAGVDLAERIRAANEGTPLADFLAGLGPDIAADKASLEGIMQRLGISASQVKQLAGKVLEKLSRARLSDRITGGASVTRLMELETLSLGIEGKLSLWRSLQQVAGTRPGLDKVELVTLADRAVAQRAGVEPHRLAAGAEAFSSMPPG
jgi:hypothetical protein